MTHLSYSLDANVGEGQHVEHTMSEDDPGHGKDPEAVQTSDGGRRGVGVHHSRYVGAQGKGTKHFVLF